MSDGLHVMGDDGVIRSVDEHYNAQGDVEQDPSGAWLAIQRLWLDREKKIARIAELEAAAQKLWRRQDSLDTYDAVVNEILTPLFETMSDAEDHQARIAELESLLETTIEAVTEVQSYEQPHDPTQENALTMRELDVFDFDVSAARAILKGEQT